MRRPSLVVLAATVALVAGACTRGDAGTSRTPGTPSPAPLPTVKVAFLEDLTVEEAVARVTPAYQGARLAFEEATLAGDLPVQVVIEGEDTGGDPAQAASLAKAMAADPEFAGVLAAPFLNEDVSTGTILDSAGVPTLSLSTLGVRLSARGWTTWRRVVADQEEQGKALARYVGGLPSARAGVCVAGDGSVLARSLMGTVTRALGRRVVLTTTLAPEQAASPGLAPAVRKAGCGVLFWGGFSAEAATIRLQLVAAGLRKVRLVAGDATKDDSYLATTGPAGEGTVVSCPCVDLSTSTKLAAQRFIQDYQAEYGTPPGVYAAEGWDAARMLIAAFREGATTREVVASFLSGLGSFEGLANTYKFRPTGELATGSAAVRLFRDQGGRWLPLTPSS